MTRNKYFGLIFHCKLAALAAIIYLSVIVDNCCTIGVRWRAVFVLVLTNYIATNNFVQLQIEIQRQSVSQRWVAWSTKGGGKI